MSNAHRNLQTKKRKRIVFVVFPKLCSLELSGPYDVFATAARDAALVGLSTTYQLEIVSLTAGPFEAFGGMRLHADRSYRNLRVTSRRSEIDTLIVVAGGSAVTEPIPTGLVNWVRRMAPHVRRVASVCTGAFVLAKAGLLDGRKVTTHWAHGEALSRCFPKISVDSDNIFTKDGRIYTSAGVTAGIDLALALVEEDLGRELAMSVARKLVVYVRRPGTQSQFSMHLKLQAAERQVLQELQAWLPDHLNEDLGVAALAERAGMSPRNFARTFQREIKMTPAKYVETIRLDARATTSGRSGVDARAGRIRYRLRHARITSAFLSAKSQHLAGRISRSLPKCTDPLTIGRRTKTLTTSLNH